MSNNIIQFGDTKKWEGCVLAYGHFNTIHPGHIRYLKHARSLGKRLVIAIGDKSKTKYPFNQKERAEAVNLLGIADGVLLLQADELMNAIWS